MVYRFRTLQQKHVFRCKRYIKKKKVSTSYHSFWFAFADFLSWWYLKWSWTIAHSVRMRDFVHYYATICGRYRVFVATKRWGNSALYYFSPVFTQTKQGLFAKQHVVILYSVRGAQQTRSLCHRWYLHWLSLNRSGHGNVVVLLWLTLASVLLILLQLHTSWYRTEGK